MGFHWSSLNPVKVVHDVAKSVADIPGSIKGFVNNPLQSVEKNVGGVVNAMSLGTIGAKNRQLVGGAVLTAGTGVLAYNALTPKTPAPPAAAVKTAGTAVNGVTAVKAIDTAGTLKDVATTAMTAGHAYQQYRGGAGVVGGGPAPAPAAAGGSSALPWVAVIVLPVLLLILRK